MTLNQGMFGTTKYNSQIATATPPTPDPYTARYDIGITRTAYYLERIVRGL